MLSDAMRMRSAVANPKTGVVSMSLSATGPNFGAVQAPNFGGWARNSGAVPEPVRIWGQEEELSRFSWFEPEPPT
jgi:hypothetical protein